MRRMFSGARNFLRTLAEDPAPQSPAAAPADEPLPENADQTDDLPFEMVREEVEPFPVLDGQVDPEGMIDLAEDAQVTEPHLSIVPTSSAAAAGSSDERSNSSDPVPDSPTALQPLTCRREAFKRVMECRRADPRNSSLIGRLAGISTRGYNAILNDGELPTDRNLMLLCRFYGIPLMISPTRKIDPSHYEGMTAEERRGPPRLSPEEGLMLGRTRERTKPQAAVVSERPASPIEPGSTNGSQATVLAVLPATFDAESVVSRIEGLKNDAAKSARLELSLRASEKRVRTLESKLCAAEARADKAEKKLSQIFAVQNSDD